jgi:hypothetical protein
MNNMVFKWMAAECSSRAIEEKDVGNELAFLWLVQMADRESSEKRSSYIQSCSRVELLQEGYVSYMCSEK